MSDDLQDMLQNMLDQVINDILDIYLSEDIHSDEWDFEGLVHHLQQFDLVDEINEKELKEKPRQQIKAELIESAYKTYQKQADGLGSDLMNQVTKHIALQIIDRKWMSHLDNMERLRQGIGLRAYGQKDPLTEYKFESFDMFNEMSNSIREDIVKYVLQVEVKTEDESLSTSSDRNTNLNYQHKNKSVFDSVANSSQTTNSKGNSRGQTNQEPEQQQPIVKPDEPGRNDPCPCGSGKKYKKCCGR
jgi:preprotein translocase subunit SecA